MDPYKDFVVCIDACKEGLGGVLIQEIYVVEYGSRKLKQHEKNATCDLELATVIHALKMWRHYLIGRRFLLMSDNISLKYLFDQNNLNVRQATWLAFLSEYEFEIKHIKGKENKFIDALIRHVNLIYMAIGRIYETNLENKIRTGAENDGKHQNYKHKILEYEAENENSDSRISKNGLLMYKNKLYIPNSEEIKLLILNETHKKPYSRHPEYQEMITMLRREFYLDKCEKLNSEIFN